MEVHIIGAGPVGSHLAKILASEGLNVTIWEARKKVGEPVQCTGIVTSELNSLVPLKKEYLVNNLKKAELNGPRSKAILNLDDIVICRKRFDQHLSKKAVKAGASLMLEHRFVEIKDNQLIFKQGNKTKKIKFSDKDVLVGADGPSSAVSKLIGNDPLKFWTGMQARIKTKVEKEKYKVWFGEEFFAWSVPESETVTRVGLAGTKKLDERFKKLLKNFPKAKIIEKQGGMIPKYDPKLKVQSANIYLVGDAASQVKATTGGGIVPGIKAAECLAEAILTGNDYQRLLMKVNNNLKKHLLIRIMLDKFSKNDYDELLTIIDKENKMFSKYNRDKSPLRLGLKLVLKRPKLVRFGLKLFK